MILFFLHINVPTMRDAVISCSHLLSFFLSHLEWDEVSLSRGRGFITSAEAVRLLSFRRFCEFLMGFSCTNVIRECDIFSTYVATELKDALNFLGCVDAEMCTTHVRTLTHSTQIASCDSGAKSVSHCSSQSLRLGRASNQKCIMSMSVCGKSSSSHLDPA